MGAPPLFPPAPPVPGAATPGTLPRNNNDPTNCPDGQEYDADLRRCMPIGTFPKGKGRGGGGENGGGGCPQPGQIRDASGACKCPPGQTIHGDSTRGCEPENGELCDPAAHPAFNQRTGRIDESNPEAECFWCDFSTRTWKKGYCPGAGGGPGAGAAGAGKPRTAGIPGMPSDDFARMLEELIRKDLNAPSRFSPEIMQRMFGQVTSQSAGRIQRGQRDVLAQAARAGRSGRWGSTQAGLRDVRNQAETERGRGNLQVELTKINADFQDKQAALSRAENFLNSMRDNEYRYTLMGEQRRQFDANLALAYANLAQQKTMLQMNLQSQWDMMRAMQGFLSMMNGV